MILGLDIKLIICFFFRLNLVRLWKRLVLFFEYFLFVISKWVWEELFDGVIGVIIVFVELVLGIIGLVDGWVNVVLGENNFCDIILSLVLFLLFLNGKSVVILNI